MLYQIVGTFAALFVGACAWQLLRPVKRQQYHGQHVIVTGGSQGMGKAVALEYVKRGANVTIIARTQSTLDAAVLELKSASLSENQRIQSRSVDCAQSDAIIAAIREVGTPDVLFCCAGTAHPGLFADLPPEDMARPMTGNYLSSMFTAHAALRSMLQNPTKQHTSRRKIIFTSSVAAFLNLPGYASYTPTKTAIRGLTDSLRLECLMHNIDVHCIFPATIYSPGYENEEKLKPKITKILEEGDSGQTPAQVAAAAMSGLDRGYSMICTTLIGDLLRCNMKGASPKNGPVDIIYGLIASIALPFVLADFESKVRKHSKTLQ